MYNSIKKIYIFIKFIYLFVFLIPTKLFATDLDIQISNDYALEENRVVVSFLIKLPPEYYVYSHVKQDLGKPTSLYLTSNKGEKAPIFYPKGIMRPDFYEPNIMVSIYSGNIMFFSSLPSDSVGEIYNGKLDLLLCSKKHCVPLQKSFSFNIPDNLSQVSLKEWFNLWNETLKNSNNNNNNESKLNINVNLDNVLPQYIDNMFEISWFGKAILFGFLAGIILNLMPCVLPVLALKLNHLVIIKNNSLDNEFKTFRQHNFFFVAGIISMFVLLAIILSSIGLFWGQLYQNKIIVFFMIILIYFMALSMFGMINLPMLDLSFDKRFKQGKMQSYFTGLISTFLATPCSGPLLGGVLAWGLSQSIIIQVIVFISIGFGMSLPYIIVSFFPSLAKYLPRPGKWMHILEYFLGFLLLATTIYLILILPNDLHLKVLIFLIVISCIVILKNFFLKRLISIKNIISFIISSCLVLSVFFIFIDQDKGITWTILEKDSFERDLGKKILLVEFTANWCPNCKFLEKTVLSQQKIKDWQEKYGVELLKVDLTSDNAYGQHLLKVLDSKSIPLTAVFPKGDSSIKPFILRDIYTMQKLKMVMDKVLTE